MSEALDMRPYEESIAVLERQSLHRLAAGLLLVAVALEVSAVVLSTLSGPVLGAVAFGAAVLGCLTVAVAVATVVDARLTRP